MSEKNKNFMSEFIPKETKEKLGITPEKERAIQARAEEERKAKFSASDDPDYSHKLKSSILRAQQDELHENREQAIERHVQRESAIAQLKSDLENMPDHEGDKEYYPGANNPGTSEINEAGLANEKYDASSATLEELMQEQRKDARQDKIRLDTYRKPKNRDVETKQPMKKEAAPIKKLSEFDPLAQRPKNGSDRPNESLGNVKKTKAKRFLDNFDL